VPLWRYLESLSRRRPTGAPWRKIFLKYSLVRERLRYRIVSQPSDLSKNHHRIAALEVRDDLRATAVAGPGRPVFRPAQRPFRNRARRDSLKSRWCLSRPFFPIWATFSGSLAPWPLWPGRTKHGSYQRRIESQGQMPLFFAGSWEKETWLAPGCGFPRGPRAILD